MQVGLLNVDGYYNYFFIFIDKVVDDGFIKLFQCYIFVFVFNVKEFVKKLEVIKVKMSWIVFVFYYNFIYYCCCRNMYFVVKVLCLSFVGRCDGLEND